MITIEAAGVVEAPADAVFDHLADLRTGRSPRTAPASARALLAIGGKRWLAALFERVLSRLAAIGPDLPSGHAAAGGISPAGRSAVARL